MPDVLVPGTKIMIIPIAIITKLHRAIYDMSYFPKSSWDHLIANIKGHKCLCYNQNLRDFNTSPDMIWRRCVLDLCWVTLTAGLPGWHDRSTPGPGLGAHVCRSWKLRELVLQTSPWLSWDVSCWGNDFPSLPLANLADVSVFRAFTRHFCFSSIGNQTHLLLWSILFLPFLAVS